VTTPLRVSAAIITLNEEANLPRCLASLRGLVSETVVLDSGSTDGTRAIAEATGARFAVHPWEGHVAQKNRVLELASEPWVLCLDADEVVSPELAASMRQAFARGDPAVNGFLVNRLTRYLGEWIRHAWYPEWRLRLVRRSAARWGGSDPHDKLVVDGPTARLSGHLLHYSYADLQDHLHRTVRYARVAADARARAGWRCRWYHLVVSPWAAFLKHLVVKQGWRDGMRGWIISFSALVSVFAKYAFLIEKQLAAGGPPHGSAPPSSPAPGVGPASEKTRPPR
jgi:glycosyltransferase involved in cell wall biosynthesis